MPYNPDAHHRRSVRLQDYDYARNGAYFVTVCTYLRECLFGEIDADGIMRLNAWGEIAASEWEQTAVNRPYVELDAFVVMPNHVHGIIVIVNDTTPGRGMARHAPTQRQFSKPVAGSLPTIVGAFKSAVTKRVNAMRDMPGAPLWQRGYYETVIRNERMLHTRREYIETNPVRWAFDENHPANVRR